MYQWDEKKSLSNLEKHGIDFSEATNLWFDENAIHAEVKGLSDDQRYVIVAKYNGKHWTGVYTFRGEEIRIISVRRSRKNEVGAYES